MYMQEGFRILSRYEIIRPLGEGGMGVAHLVLDTRLNRQCVIKEVSSHDTTNQVQFEREAQILANLQHNNLPIVYDYFYDQDRPFIVMQYIEGTTLNRPVIGRDASFEIHDVLKWAKEILAAMLYMHNQEPSIIHRDIKPHNICITPENKAVLLDFGIARRMDESQTRTAAQAITIHYSPIEQYPETSLTNMETVYKYVTALHADNIRTSYYSDIYGLGATLYYALTLLPPPDACYRVLKDELRPLQEKNSEVPKFLAKAVMKALELHPRERYQSAAEMLTALLPEIVVAPTIQIPRRPPRKLPHKDIEIFDQNLVYIPASKFQMGSDEPKLKSACHPQHTLNLDAFCISRNPVTMADYLQFIEENPDHPVPHSPMRFAARYNWDKATRTFPRGLEDHPVVLITWYDALPYCKWLSNVSGYRIRLPNEAEWEKAACWDVSADRARLYPWGDDFDDNLCNLDVHGELRLQTNPVGIFSPAGDSSYGLADMVGNVWEWTSSLYQPYPYNPNDGREDMESDGKRVVRGGAYDEGPLLSRCAWRNGVKPKLYLANVGFRVACDAA